MKSAKIVFAAAVIISSALSTSSPKAGSFTLQLSISRQSPNCLIAQSGGLQSTHFKTLKSSNSLKDAYLTLMIANRCTHAITIQEMNALPVLNQMKAPIPPFNISLKNAKDEYLS
ncbi:MAG: hypothetical protein IT560_13630, partial [Alphaproteobacteria bacterium]|nr:hypothetical protein [Alphaproteobacteria bacterium]